MCFISCQTVRSVNMWRSGFITTSNVRPFSDNSTVLMSSHDLFTTNLKKWLSTVFIKAGCSKWLGSIGWRMPKVVFCSLSYYRTYCWNPFAPSTNQEGKNTTVQMSFSHLPKPRHLSESMNCGIASLLQMTQVVFFKRYFNILMFPLLDTRTTTKKTFKRHTA